MKVGYIISGIRRWQSFEWICEEEKDWELFFIIIDDKESYFAKYLEDNAVEHYVLEFLNKRSYPRLIYKIQRILKKENPDIVHTHFQDATITGLLAAYMAKIPHRIYTRHHSTFHKLYARKGAFWDKLSDRLATKIVAISDNVKNILLQEGVDIHKIETIEHGFKLEEFFNSDDQSRSRLYSKYDLEDSDPVIGVVARHIKWKGVQYVIPAFRQILNQYPKATLLLCNARGDYHHVILKLLEDIPESRYRIIPFENNMSDLYHVFDVYVHVPINEVIEAFGQTYVEALACGIPSVFTLSGIGKEIVDHNENALVVDFCDSEQIMEAILKLLGSSELKEQLSANAYRKIDHRFAFSTHFARLNNLYYSCSVN